MKKVLVVLLTAVMLISIAGCTPGEEPGGDTDDKIVVGMSMIDYTNPGFIGIKTGADEAAEDYDIELIWKGCEGNLDTQIDVIRGFIQQGVDVIMVDSVDVNGLVSVVDEATAIKVLAIGSPAGKRYHATPDYIVRNSLQV